MGELTFGDGPPGQRDVREVRVEWSGLLPLALLPQVEGLREAAHRPQRVVRAVVQFCRQINKTLLLLYIFRETIILCL